MRWWDWYWVGWLIAAFGGFEAWALASGHPERTLSETVWRWFDVVPGKTLTQWSITHFILLFFMVWLFGHMVLGLWHKWH